MQSKQKDLCLKSLYFAAYRPYKNHYLYSNPTSSEIKSLKVSLLLINLIFSFTISAQKYYTKTGITEFDGSKAAFEPIKAKNNSSISAIRCGCFFL